MNTSRWRSSVSPVVSYFAIAATMAIFFLIVYYSREVLAHMDVLTSTETGSSAQVLNK